MPTNNHIQTSANPIVIPDEKSVSEEVVLLDNAVSAGLERTAKVSEKIARNQEETKRMETEKAIHALDAVTNSLRMLQEMKETIIGRLEWIRALPSGGFPGEHMLIVNPGYKGFVVGLDGKFHEVEIGKTTLNALGEKGGFFRNLFTSRTTENVAFFTYRTEPIQVSLCWPDLNYSDAPVLTQGFIDDVIVPKIKTSEIRTIDDIRGWVDVDLQLLIVEPQILFKTAITGKRAFLQFIEGDLGELVEVGDAWHNKNLQKGKLSITADYIYEATKRELVRAIARAIFNFNAKDLYEDKTARDSACDEVRDHMSRTLESIGLKLIRINNLTFHALEYEERMTRKSNIKIEREKVEEAKDKLEIEKDLATAEVEFKKLEVTRDAEIKVHKVESEMGVVSAEAKQQAARNAARREENHKDTEADIRRREAEFELELKMIEKQQAVVLEFFKSLAGLDREAQKLAIVAKFPQLAPVFTRMLQAQDEQNKLSGEIEQLKDRVVVEDKHHKEMVRTLSENRDLFSGLIAEAIRGGFSTLGHVLETQNRSGQMPPPKEIKTVPVEGYLEAPKKPGPGETKTGETSGAS
jgi:hypothetical protein